MMEQSHCCAIDLVVQPWNRHPFAGSSRRANKERQNQSKRQPHFIPDIRHEPHSAVIGGDEMKVEYVEAVVEEGGVVVDQLFHDPDGYIIEICNCQNLPVLPLSSSCPLKKKLPTSPNTNQTTSFSGEVEALMISILG